MQFLNHELRGHLLNQASGAPLAGFTVRAFALDAGSQPRDLGYDLTDAAGRFALVYTVLHSAETSRATESRLRLHVLDPQGTSIHQTEIPATAAQRQPVEIRIPVPASPERPSPKVADLAPGLKLPQYILRALTRRNILTLADLRQAGGIGNIGGLPVAADHPALRKLQAHAQLDALSPDVQLNAALVEKGYISPSAIASASRADFVAAAGDKLDDSKAAQLHTAARAQTRFAASVLADVRTHLANGFTPTAPVPQVPGLPQATCGCRSCEAAVGPVAYLADLLDYALAHLKNGAAPITLQFLATTFHQPFGDLIASCESMDSQVPQARLCADALRRYLAARPPSPARRDTLDQARRAYRLAVYTTLLDQIGTSYEEIRLARTADQQARAALADRLGIELGPDRPDNLDALFLDSVALEAIAEPELERLFGFAATTRDPLGDGPVPHLQTLRLQRLRSLWRQRDWPAQPPAGARPIVDPDLIGPGELRNPAAGDPAFDLWQARRTFVDQTLAHLRSTRETRSSLLEGLDAVLTSALGVPAAALAALARQREEGTELSGELERLGLANDAFSRLARIHALIVSPAPVLESEWSDVYSILAQVQKRRAYSDWRHEEQARDVVLGPDHFQIPEPPPSEFLPPAPTPLPAWRATLDARRAWQDTLRGRIEQEKAVVDALRAAVAATEEATLPMLRDALILATDAPGTDLATRARWLTDHLLIDAQAGGTQRLTRIAQAIETVQGIVFSVRTGQLRDTFPDLALEADDFDEEWRWIGSYQTWRAAMLVFLYPENILLPGLRRWQTPAFGAMVETLRANRRLTPRAASHIAGAYADYFRDVCSLTLEAACQARTRLQAGDGHWDRSAADYRDLFYLFARGMTGTVYWSAYDPTDDSGYAQTFWTAVPGLANVVGVVGAAPYQVAPEQRCILLFVRTHEKGVQKLVFVRYDLETQSWAGEPTELELPDDAEAFTAAISQTNTDQQPPELAIQVPGGAIYYAGLDREGSGWDQDGEWEPLVGEAQESGLELLAIVGLGARRFYLFARNLATGSLTFRVFCDRPLPLPMDLPSGSHLLDRFREDPRWRSLGAIDWLGAFRWPATDVVYAFSSTAGLTRYHVIDTAPGSPEKQRISDVAHFDAWLRRVSGLSLDAITANLDQASVATASRSRTRTPGHLSGRSLLDHFEASKANAAGKRSLDALLTSGAFARHLASQPGWAQADLIVRANAKIVPARGQNERPDPHPGGGHRPGANAPARPGVITPPPTALTPVQPPGAGARVEAGIAAALGGLLNGFAVELPDLADTPPALPAPFLNGLERVAVLASDADPPPEQRSSRLVAYQRSAGQPGPFRAVLSRNQTNGTLSASGSSRVAPVVEGRLEIPDRLSDLAVQARKQAFEDNAAGPRSNLTYLEEAFVPVQLALQLQARGEYTTALDWYRTVYDYSQPVDSRKMWPGLEQEETLAPLYARAEDWLRDPLNPHAIAATRANACTRFTLLSLVRCFLEFADAEFTRDTAESVPRARTLYLTALELLDLPELKQRLSACEDVIGSLDIALGDPQWQPVLHQIERDLVRLGSLAIVAAAAD
ncbi:MAG: hypothetical protein HY329_28560, partial [Chloroflexi bacterium]|nr:hypothetical protein [Chloroflexota bacterium]